MNEEIKCPYGLKNYGVTCYMNVSIQAVTQIFKDFFSSGEYSVDTTNIPLKYLDLLKEDEKLESFHEFINNFAYLVTSIENHKNKWSDKHVQFYLEKFREFIVIFQKADLFFSLEEKSKQHDSHDFFIFLLEILSKSFSYTAKFNISIKDEKKITKEDKEEFSILKSYESWSDEFSIKCDENKTVYFFSKIAEELCGQLHTSISCKNVSENKECCYSSEKFDPFYSLTLTIQDNETKKIFSNLEDCLNNYMETEILDEENQWYCEKCKKKSRAEKKTVIWKTASHIIFHFKRFMTVKTVMGYMTMKDSHNVNFPFELDLSEYTEFETNEKRTFHLCFVANHVGSLQSGHYFCYRKIENDWFCFNDKQVSKIEKERVVTPNAYYLIYQYQQ
jgi:ubiquitin carboxyl-terminal hydrolase 8